MLLFDLQLFAHKKGVSSTKNGRDSNAQRLGTKMHDGMIARPGNIIVRQRGTHIHPGLNVRLFQDEIGHFGCVNNFSRIQKYLR